MPYELQWSASGVLALCADPQMAPKLRAIVKAAHLAMWREWCSARGNARFGLHTRFGRAAFAKLGLTPRSRGYQKRQLKVFGELRAYESPNLSRPPERHMRALLKHEKVGWRIAGRDTSDEVVSRLYLPGARAINFHAQYRKEFLALDQRTAERAWMLARVNELVAEALGLSLQRSGGRQARSQQA